ncbi:MAG: ATP synthase subunit I [Candidatus Acidiferrales bacterium]
MSDAVHLMLVLTTGVLLGAIFFGGLWWTIQKGLSSKSSALWFFSSLLLRTSVVLIGFYFIGRGHWERLVVCLLGFIMARFVVTWLTRSWGENQTRPAQEIRHAP